MRATFKVDRRSLNVARMAASHNASNNSWVFLIQDMDDRSLTCHNHRVSSYTGRVYYACISKH
jgi:hypothetical protein